MKGGRKKRMNRKELYEFVKEFRMAFCCATYADTIKDNDRELYTAFLQWEKCEREREPEEENKEGK